MSLTATLVGDDIVLDSLSDMAKCVPIALRKCILKEGAILAGNMKKGIRDQAPGGVAFKPLAASTRKMKKNKSKALIMYGDLMRSINVTEVGDIKTGGAAFVGVHRMAKAKGKTGGRRRTLLVNIAAIHEYGTKPFKIPVTPRLRRFFWAMYLKGVFRKPLRKATKVINHPGVPKRSYIRTAFEAWKVGASERIAWSVIAELSKQVRAGSGAKGELA
jgi:hypothetical protein